VSYLQQINQEQLPKHIAVIMDGNGRWAKQQGKNRVFGHSQGVKAVRRTVEACVQAKIQYLTLYVFSTENWQRPPTEVQALMLLLGRTIKQEAKQLHKQNIRLNAIGNLDSLPSNARKHLQNAINLTQHNTGLTLTLALSYSSRWEITRAVRLIAQQVENGQLRAEHIDENTVTQALSTYNMPDPELLIRTSGECRISNYLLWQLAYTELFFLQKFWPDFQEEDLYKAVVDFQQRDRRFGKVK